MAKNFRLIYETPSQPRQVRLDITTACNAKCLSCHRFLTTRSGNMPKSFIKEILQDISNWNKPLEEIIPVNYGEFFCNKEWKKYLRLINEALPRTNIVIPTNGSLITNEDVEFICSINTVGIINFSVNAFFEKTYEEFMGLKGETLDNILNLATLFRKYKPEIQLVFSMVYDPAYQTEMEKELFLAFWRNYGIPWTIPASNCNRYPLKIKNNIACRSIFSDLVIGFDGKLSSCCFDPGMVLDLGKWEGSVLGAWNNPKLQELRKLHNEGRRQEVGWCSGCSFS